MAVVVGALASMAVWGVVSALLQKLNKEEGLTDEEIAKTEGLYTGKVLAEAVGRGRQQKLAAKYAPDVAGLSREAAMLQAGMRDEELGIGGGSALDRLMALTGKSRGELAAQLNPKVGTPARQSQSIAETALMRRGLAGLEGTGE